MGFKMLVGIKDAASWACGWPSMTLMTVFHLSTVYARGHRRRRAHTSDMQRSVISVMPGSRRGDFDALGNNRLASPPEGVRRYIITLTDPRKLGLQASDLNVSNFCCNINGMQDMCRACAKHGFTFGGPAHD